MEFMLVDENKRPLVFSYKEGVLTINVYSTPAATTVDGHQKGIIIPNVGFVKKRHDILFTKTDLYDLRNYLDSILD